MSDRNPVYSDQAVGKNHDKPSLLISILEPSNEGRDDISTDLINKLRTLLAY